jgi:3',5'-cyclic AMP phosphodiesterase CpdA
MTQPIRILHISDVHFRLGKAWDAEPVLREFAGFIEREMADGLVPDVVIFSGDMAFSGSKAEYDIARTWLNEQLWPALPDGMPGDRLLLIPGNHDVDRKKVGKGVQSM